MPVTPAFVRAAEAVLRGALEALAMHAEDEDKYPSPQARPCSMRADWDSEVPERPTGLFSDV